MSATFRNLYDQFNMAAFIRDRRTHAMSVLRWTLILVTDGRNGGNALRGLLVEPRCRNPASLCLSWLLYLLPIGGFVVGLLYI